MSMLEFWNVSKSFWSGGMRKVILHDASFRIHSGQSVGILAPNGSGKTTIINMMAGVEQPDSGLIIRQCRVSFPLGFMGGLNVKHSATENVRYIARLYQMDPDAIEAFCRWLCDIGSYFDEPLGIYSQGMKARLSVALMLSLDFDLYLVDEGMPVTTDKRFDALASEIMRERLSRATMLIVSHQPDILARYCTTRATLHRGGLVLDASVS